MKQTLNGTWRLVTADNKYDINAAVPGSLYAALLSEKLIDDPYYRDNEYKSTYISDTDCVFSRGFDADAEMLAAKKQLLKFYGIDTISEITLNGVALGSTDNMHREYVFDVSDILKPTDNLLTVKIFSPIKYIADKNKTAPLWGVASTMEGYPHIRKAHYMYGWDWGPMLPDMGIWRDVELIGVNGGLLDGVYVMQNHDRTADGIVGIETDIDVAHINADDLTVKLTVAAPNGETITADTALNGKTSLTIPVEITDAELWYPRGYGKQPLYKLTVGLYSGETLCDTYETNIGLRTVTVSRDDLGGEEDGEEFAFTVNGIKLFAMGANYIPEDQIIPHCSYEKTKRLLEMCCKANYNMIRVWGGGYYPENYFYDECDRLGLLVWQDFMFACSVYKADDAFIDTVCAEVADNVKRLRNHPSLAMWCGNNEIESMWQYWGIREDQQQYKDDYLVLFEDVIPTELEKYDPVTFYWPSSPSSGGGFDGSSDEIRGDSHYWSVWHGLKPFTDYYNYHYRFCSEFGFESVPCMKTVDSFAEPRDLNLCCPVMEAHQKCEAGTEKIMYYLAQMVHYPYSFPSLVYATQIVQADAVRINAEHMRRARGTCMGCLYWQVNDSNPVISWSSIDCYGRLKALHYHAAKFYAPVLITAETNQGGNIVLNVSSERQQPFSAKVVWNTRLNTGEIIAYGEKEITVQPLHAEDVLELSCTDTKIPPEIKNCAYVEFSLIEKETTISAGISVAVQPKAFRFIDPKLKTEVRDAGDRLEISVTASSYAKDVYLETNGFDCVFSDNWFDIHADTVTVYVDKSELPQNITAEEFEKALTVMSYYEAMGLSRME
ncbi:MAG: glycoside hydrolase family 2 protein [Eubacterium sp.]|nr:glycoside hydrolase family 2 protein [Eubacterium sp.]